MVATETTYYLVASVFLAFISDVSELELQLKRSKKRNRFLRYFGENKKHLKESANSSQA